MVSGIFTCNTCGQHFMINEFNAWRTQRPQAAGCYRCNPHGLIIETMEVGSDEIDLWAFICPDCFYFTYYDEPPEEQQSLYCIKCGELYEKSLVDT